MTPLQIELTKLIGKKELSFGCIIKSINTGWIRRLCDYSDLGKDEDWTYNFWIITEAVSYIEMQNCSIIGHPATLSDFQRWMNSKKFYSWGQHKDEFIDAFFITEQSWKIDRVSIDSSKDILDQSEETLQQIIDLVKKYS